MAAPPHLSSSTARPARSGLLRAIGLAIVAIIVLIGLVVLITWLVVKPKKLVYTIESSKVDGFDLHYNQLNASFDLVLQAYNPNKRVSFYYDSMSVSVVYDDQTVAFESVKPFYQKHRNVNRIESKPVARNAPLQASVAKDLRLEKSSGEIKVKVQAKARIRVKVGRWKSRHYTLRIKCSQVVVNLHASKTSYKEKRCDVDT